MAKAGPLTFRGPPGWVTDPTWRPARSAAITPLSAPQRLVNNAKHDEQRQERLASLLERSGYEVVGQAADGTQLLTLAREAGPTW